MTVFFKDILSITASNNRKPYYPLTLTINV